MFDWIVNIILPALGGVAGWFVGKRQRIVEVKKGELENVESGLSIYKDMLEDLRRQIGILRGRQDELEQENKGLRAKLAETKKSNNDLRKRISALETQLKKEK